MMIEVTSDPSRQCKYVGCIDVSVRRESRESTFENDKGRVSFGRCVGKWSVVKGRERGSGVREMMVEMERDLRNSRCLSLT